MNDIDKLDGMIKIKGKCGYEIIGGCKELRKYKQALEEIRETILNYESKEWNCFNDMDAKLEKISEILDEVLNDRN